MRKLFVIFMIIMLSGCATVNSMTETVSNFFTKKEIKYYPECYEYIDKIDAKYSDKGLSAAVKGALIGGTIGVAAGAIAGDYKTAIVAGAAGAGIGAASAYSYVWYKRYLIGNSEERFLSYLTDINEDSEIYKEVVVLINDGITKFNKELKLLSKNEKKYSKEEFTERFTELKEGIEKLEKYYIAGKEEVVKTQEIYADVAVQEEKQYKESKEQKKQTISPEEYAKMQQEVEKLKKELEKANKQLKESEKKYQKLDTQFVAAKEEITRLEQRVQQA